VLTLGRPEAFGVGRGLAFFVFLNRINAAKKPLI